MARIDVLISQVKDPKLQAQLAEAAVDLRRRRKFGLVFENHIPETVALATQVGLRPGATVRLRIEPDDQRDYTVNEVSGKKAVVSIGEGTRTVGVSDLLVVKPFGEPIYPVLRQSHNSVVRSPERPFHTVINGENFFALEMLQFAHRGQVDLIYADPPYNGGQSTWAYNNRIVDPKDSWRHSKWASMMEKRLKLCKSLLKPDTGIAVIAIDENEVAHLSMLLEDVFRDYWRQMVTVVSNPRGTGKANIARVDEYLFFIIPKNGQQLVKLPSTPAPWQVGRQDDGGSDELLEELGQSQEEDDDVVDDEEEAEVNEATYPFSVEELPLWELRHARRRGGESSYRSQRPNQFYPLWINEESGVVVRAGKALASLQTPPSFRRNGGLRPIWPIDAEGNERCWRYVPESMTKLIDAGRVVLGRYNATTDSYTVNYWVKSNTKKRVKTVWWETRHDAGTHGTSLLHKLLGDRQAFNFPKSLYAVADALDVALRDRSDALVVDPFGGSGTTIHALALLNAFDGGHRRGILITNNELDLKTTKKLHEEGLYTGDEAFEERGIYRRAAVPRIEAAFTGKQAKNGKPIAAKYRYVGGGLMANGFAENAAFFDMVYENPDSIAAGERFNDILPLLWLASGSVGEPGKLRPTKVWMLDKSRPFAVLIDEDHFREFCESVRVRDDLTHVWIVTDSESAFARYRSRLPERLICGMLYRDYLRSCLANARLVPR